MIASSIDYLLDFFLKFIRIKTTKSNDSVHFCQNVNKKVYRSQRLIKLVESAVVPALCYDLEFIVSNIFLCYVVSLPEKKKKKVESNRRFDI